MKKSIRFFTRVYSYRFGWSFSFFEAYTVDGKNKNQLCSFFYTGFRISACSMITSGSCWTFSMRAYKHSMMKKDRM